MVIAASVANFKDLIFDIVGSKTPAFLLSRTVPVKNTKHFNRLNSRHTVYLTGRKPYLFPIPINAYKNVLSTLT